MIRLTNLDASYVQYRSINNYWQISHNVRFHIVIKMEIIHVSNLDSSKHYWKKALTNPGTHLQIKFPSLKVILYNILIPSLIISIWGTWNNLIKQVIVLRLFLFHWITNSFQKQSVCELIWFFFLLIQDIILY